MDNTTTTTTNNNNDNGNNNDNINDNDNDNDNNRAVNHEPIADTSHFDTIQMEQDNTEAQTFVDGGDGSYVDIFSTGPLFAFENADNGFVQNSYLVDAPDDRHVFSALAEYERFQKAKQSTPAEAGIDSAAANASSAAIESAAANASSAALTPDKIMDDNLSMESSDDECGLFNDMLADLLISNSAATGSFSNANGSVEAALMDSSQAPNEQQPFPSFSVNLSQNLEASDAEQHLPVSLLLPMEITGDIAAKKSFGDTTSDIEADDVTAMEAGDGEPTLIPSPSLLPPRSSTDDSVVGNVTESMFGDEGPVPEVGADELQCPPSPISFLEDNASSVLHDGTNTAAYLEGEQLEAVFMDEVPVEDGKQTFPTAYLLALPGSKSMAPVYNLAHHHHIIQFVHVDPANTPPRHATNLLSNSGTDTSHHYHASTHEHHLYKCQLHIPTDQAKNVYWQPYVRMRSCTLGTISSFSMPPVRDHRELTETVKRALARDDPERRKFVQMSHHYIHMHEIYCKDLCFDTPWRPCKDDTCRLFHFESARLHPEGYCRSTVAIQTRTRTATECHRLSTSHLAQFEHFHSHYHTLHINATKDRPSEVRPHARYTTAMISKELKDAKKPKAPYST